MGERYQVAMTVRDGPNWVGFGIEDLNSPHRSKPFRSRP